MKPTWINTMTEPMSSAAGGIALYKLGAFGGLAVDVITIVFGITFFWVSAEYAFDAQGELSEITEMSMGLVYVAFPVSALSWIMFLGEQIYDDLFTAIRGEK